jgi:hypothetical protein
MQIFAQSALPHNSRVVSRSRIAEITPPLLFYMSAAVRGGNIGFDVQGKRISPVHCLSGSFKVCETRTNLCPSIPAKSLMIISKY